MKRTVDSELINDIHSKLTVDMQPNFKKGDEVTFWDNNELCIGIINSCIIRRDVFRYQLRSVSVAFSAHWHSEDDLESLNKIY